MDFSSTDRVKEHMTSSDPKLRKLALEDRGYEARLAELSSLAYPTDEEQVEEIALQKKRLSIKDQMYSLMLQYQKKKSSEGRMRGSLPKNASATRGLTSSRNATEKTPDQLFPDPRTRLIEAAFAAHAESLEHGDDPLSIEEINAEVAERRGGAQGDASH
jgi:hypothetical protein